MEFDTHPERVRHGLGSRLVRTAANIGLFVAVAGALLTFTNDVEALDYVGLTLMAVGVVTEIMFTLPILLQRIRKN
jgi:uncharacterized membrane protein